MGFLWILNMPEWVSYVVSFCAQMGFLWFFDMPKWVSYRFLSAQMGFLRFLYMPKWVMRFLYMLKWVSYVVSLYAQMGSLWFFICPNGFHKCHQLLSIHRCRFFDCQVTQAKKRPGSEEYEDPAESCQQDKPGNHSTQHTMFAPKSSETAVGA